MNDDKTHSVSEETSDLLYTQSLRKKVIDKLIEYHSGEVPIDKEGASILSMYLDGMDKQSISKERIKIAKKDSKTNEQVAKLLEEMSRKRNSGEAVDIDMTPSPLTIPRAQLLSGEFLPSPTLQSGELDWEPSYETPESFFKRVESAHPELLTGGALDDD